MTYEDFVKDVFDAVKECPKDWRTGQAVFNVIDYKYGVARQVQFRDGIDCFYRDDEIENFLRASWQRVSLLKSITNLSKNQKSDK